MKPSWTARPYRPGDESGLCDLYREVFNLNFTPEFWRWAFQQSPDGPQILALIEQDGRIAGQYAVQPRRFWFNGQLCTAGYAGGTMLAPAARNVATLVAMAQLAYKLCHDRGLSWLYCCPNEQALPVRRTLLNWGQLPDVVEWDGPLPHAAAAEGTNVRVWSRMPDELSFDSFAPAPNGKPIQSQRSTAWLRWRFFERPGGEYVLHTIDDGQQVSGYAVTKRYRREGVMYGHVVDWQLQSQSTSAVENLLTSVWRQLDQWNVQRVSCWADGDETLIQSIARAGLTSTGRKSYYCYYDLVGDHKATLAQQANWRIVMADCDVY